MEDERLRLLGVPLGPVNPETFASVGVQVVGESNDIILEFTPWTKRVYEVRRVSLVSKSSAVFGASIGLELRPTDPIKGISFMRFQTWRRY